MINHSLAFRKINKNTYHFRNGSIYCKKVYIINAKEKNRIERILHSYYKFLSFSLCPLVVGSLYNLWFTCGIFLIISFCLFINLRKQINKVTSGKEKISIEPLGLKRAMKIKAEKMNFTDARSVLFTSLIILASSIYWFYLSILNLSLLMISLSMVGILIGSINFYLFFIIILKLVNKKSEAIKS